MLIIMMILFFTIAMILMTLNLLISKKKKNDREKFSSFECGFDPMSSSRLPFSIQFFMISIIFLIFDIELVILLPMIPSFIYSSIELSSSSLFYFIMMLIMGLYIEWNDGALKWLK